jgi:hypothetical protein
MKKGLDIKYYNESIHSLNNGVKIDLNSEEIADSLTHTHEKITDLKRKFGNNLPVIAVRRNRYERYISLWKHIIDELYRVNEMGVYEIFKNLTTDELLSYTSEDLISNDTKYEAIQSFLKRVKSKKHGPYVTTMMYIQMSPTSHYHNHDSSIIWFDIDKLNKLEEWVSNQIGTEFKLDRVNSSQHFECNLKLDEHFIEKYDSIYNIYDMVKKNKTLI